MKKLVIFDFDGTLVDSLGGLASAVNYVLRVQGFAEHSVDKIKTFIGDGVLNLLQRSLPKDRRDPDTLGRTRDLFFEYYDAHSADNSNVYDGINELLNELKQRDIAVAIVSNKYDKATKEMAEYFFPNMEFSVVYGQRKGVPLKPAPDVIFEVMDLVEITDAKDVLYVGDSDVDMMVGANAGVDRCAVSWGFNSREELLSFAPELMADHPRDILEYCL